MPLEAKNAIIYRFFAAVAQLVERNLAKVEVESSRLFCRSRFFAGESEQSGFPVLLVVCVTGAMTEWLCGGLQSRLRRFDSGSRLQESLTEP